MERMGVNSLFLLEKLNSLSTPTPALKLEKAFALHPTKLGRVESSVRLLNTSLSRVQTVVKPSILELTHGAFPSFTGSDSLFIPISPLANKSLGFISSIVKWLLHKRAKALEKPESAWSTNSNPILQLECFYVNQGWPAKVTTMKEICASVLFKTVATSHRQLWSSGQVASAVQFRYSFFIYF